MLTTYNSNTDTVNAKDPLFTDIMLRVFIISAMIGSWVGIVFGVVKLSGVV